MKIEFRTSGAAFGCGDDEEMNKVYLQDECVRILRKIAHDISCGKTYGVIRDINGNRIGRFDLSDEV